MWIIGNLILNKLNNIINKNGIGLYRDDGLGVFGKLSGPQIEQRKRRIFKDCGLSITIATKITSADFLDLTLYSKTEFYQQFSKPNSDPLYTDSNSNHSPQKVKQLPKTISKRLSENSSSKDVFDKSKMLYKKSVNNSGFYESLTYHQDNGNKNQRKKIKKRQRKIKWFNPPFLKIVKTNVSKKFFKLINRHFLNHHKMPKIF